MLLLYHHNPRIWIFLFKSQHAMYNKRIEKFIFFVEKWRNNDIPNDRD